MSLPQHVTLVEVSPRDGLQNIANFVPTEIKIEFINQLSQTGLPVIEVTSFVAADKIPQIADNKAVLMGITQNLAVKYPVLVPNIEGFNAAIAAGAKSIAVFGAASETFSQKNINCSIAESMQRFAKVIQAAKQQQIPVRGYISCCLGCPYEGEIRPEQVAAVAKQLWQLGCYEISLGDTIGVGTPNKVIKLIDAVSQVIPIKQLAAHFHDTYGQAIANLYAALQRGIQTIDSSVAGLGGCPYAKGASGNVASEDVLYLLNGLGISTGVDLTALIKVGRFISDYLGQAPGSKVNRAW